VLATQNPIEQEGTYRLPEAQLDRFLFRIRIHYPALAEEQQILKKFRNDFTNTVTGTVQAVLSKTELQALRRQTENCTISDELLDYIALLVHTTRNHPDLFLGASPRASLAIMKTAKAIAVMGGRDFVTPDDVQQVAYPVMNHRILLTPDKELEGATTDMVIRDIIEKIPVPR
jgi:MoxR-like ATPase